jgi:predicted RNase H-like HicB family nuclease
MKKTRFVHWQDEETWLGYLEDYPDYWTQAESLAELQDNLRELYEDLTSGSIPCVRKVADLEVA